MENPHVAPADESAPPVLGKEPPDRMEGTLEYHAAMVVKLAGRDGVLDTSEMGVVADMMKALEMIAQGRTMNGEPDRMQSMAQQGADPNAGFEPGEEEPYGANAGSPKYPEEG